MKIFISSTYRDLVDYRSKTAEAIERLGQHGIRMEVFGAQPDDATKVCRDQIDESDIFVGIYAHRYGHIPSGSDQSITEMEYYYALEQEKPAFCFFVNEDHPWQPSFIEGEPARSKLKTFKKAISPSVTIDTFTTPEALAFKVGTSIGRYLYTKAIKEELDRVAEKKPIAMGTEKSRSQVARRAERLSSVINESHVLLVNDIPEEMEYVISMLKAVDISVTVATETSTAISLLKANPKSFDLVISDMSRGGVDDEGLNFLQQIRDELKLHHPVIFTVGQFQPERGTPAYAFGITNRIDEMLNLTFDILERVRG